MIDKNEENRQITPTCLDEKNQKCSGFEHRERNENGYYTDFTCAHSMRVCCGDGMVWCNAKSIERL